MPIAQLPADAVCTISSSQVLTDSRSLVKELIDNALDARASAIFVDISSNTIDLIQVRDDGHGIFPEDRRMVARRHCTSKIRSLDDLETVGKVSLGFRGEALASAAEMSGSMIVSTRIEGEPTAVSLTISRLGEIEKEERVSQATGTAVRVVDFLRSLPVRRQTAMKTSAKSLADIKLLLQAYTLARPFVRFSMKVVKAKTEKGNWMYAPKIGDCIPDAVVKIFGKRLADQCQWNVWSSSSRRSKVTLTDDGDEADSHASYTIEAFLPTPKYEVVAVNNIGQFFSVDGRPMSSNRDPFKKITNIYKSFLTSGSLMSGEDRIKDPFLCMNIVCPPRSYDINIEPAKDGVLFTNTNLVIGEIEQFFQGLYGDLQVKTSGNLPSKVAGPKARGFDLLLARKPSLVSATVSKSGDCDLANFAHKRYEQNGDPRMGANKIGIGLAAESPPSESSNSNLTLNSKQGSMASRPRWLPNMRSEDEDEIDFPNSQLVEWQSQGNPDLDEEELCRDLSNSNPWVFAKTNALVRQYDKNAEKDAGLDSNDQLYTPRRQADDLVDVKARQTKKPLQNSDSMRSGLLTPKCNEGNHVITTPSPFSDDLFPYPQRAWVNTESRADSKNSRAIDRPIDRAGLLDTWIQTPSRSHSTSPYTIDGLDDNVRYINSDRHRDAPDFVSAKTFLVGTPPNTIPDLVTRISRKPTKRSHQAIKSNPNKPFISPLNSSGHVRLLKRPENREGRLSSTHSLGVNGRTLTAQPQIEGSGTISESEAPSQVSSVHSDLALAMDYELRKQEAFQKWKENQRRNRVAEQQGKGAPEDISRPSFASPHQNRYQKAKAALHSAQPDHNVLPAPALDPSDSRAYLMRVQQREATAAPDESPSRLRKRRKTSRLPLETLREDSLVRDLNLDINTQALDLKSSLGLLGAGICKDEYIATGNINVDAFSPLDLTDMKQIRAWEVRLKELVQTLHSSEFEQQYPSSNVDMRFDLWPIFQTHQTANP